MCWSADISALQHNHLQPPPRWVRFFFPVSCRNISPILNHGLRGEETVYPCYPVIRGQISNIFGESIASAKRNFHLEQADCSVHPSPGSLPFGSLRAGPCNRGRGCYRSRGNRRGVSPSSARGSRGAALVSLGSCETVRLQMGRAVKSWFLMGT